MKKARKKSISNNFMALDIKAMKNITGGTQSFFLGQTVSSESATVIVVHKN
jgi:hypothetical protein